MAASFRATLPVAVVVALALFLVAAPSAAAGERDDLLQAGMRNLLADATPTIVDRKNVTKAELIKILDKGSAPSLVAGDAAPGTVVPAGGGRKLSQQAGYCRSRYYNCGRGCTLRCSGSTGLCYQNTWRCRGTTNLWYCDCGYYLACYYTWSGVYATCLRA